MASSQAAIQALPRLRPPCRVAMPDPGYGEHARGWPRAGHEIASVPAARLSDVARQADVLVIIHPNNPTGQRFRPEIRSTGLHGPEPRRPANEPRQTGVTGTDEKALRPCPAAARPGRTYLTTDPN